MSEDLYSPISMLDKEIKELTKSMELEAERWRNIRKREIDKYGLNVVNSDWVKELDKQHTDFMNAIMNRIMECVREQIDWRKAKNN
jgi:DnaJ-domain-containing protein 1